MPKLLLHACCAPCLSGCLPVVTGADDWHGVLHEAPDFDTTVFFYNPNIYPEAEYLKRRDEVVRYLEGYAPRGRAASRQPSVAECSASAERIEAAVAECSASAERIEAPDLPAGIRQLDKLPSREALDGRPIPFVEAAYDYAVWDAHALTWADAPERGARCVYCYAMRLEEAFRYAVQEGFDAVATTLTLSPLKNTAAVNDAGRRLSAQYGVRYVESDFKKRDGYLKSVRYCKEHGIYRQDYCGCAYSLRTTD